ncbi:MAG: hypothetical protein L6407_01700 [Candidatus Delongbacteria bacterium]|nr:hypothetical protein [Candidatus Delongbacteria bacterium]
MTNCNDLQHWLYVAARGIIFAALIAMTVEGHCNLNSGEKTIEPSILGRINGVENENNTLWKRPEMGLSFCNRSKYHES